MPNFSLSEEEATQLAAYLAGDSAPRRSAAFPADLLARGKEIIQTSGCLNCHSLPLENRFATKSLVELGKGPWSGGCLDPAGRPSSRAPLFNFTSEQREALCAFLGELKSLEAEVPMEFAQRHLRNLRCAECHGKFEGFPTLDLLGAKLKVDWTHRLLAGALPYRARPWLGARMPAYPAYAAGLARGLAALHGYPPGIELEPPIDPEAAKAGQKLVSTDGGLSCISCHAVGSTPATQVFENAGINLAYSHARLRKPFYERWLRNPLSIDPVSRMPTFFDEDLRSVLGEIYDGDGAKQIEAIWQYLRLGEQMPPPPNFLP
jgi:mono/diheme cytochrome c family protein